MPTKILTRALLEAAMRQSIADHPEIQRKWIDVQDHFGSLAGPATLLPFAMNARVDMLLRTLEAENLQRGQYVGDPDVEFAGDLILSLSESWVSRCYEIVRAARDWMKERKEVFPDRLAQLLYQLALVRMPIDKGEIADAHRHKGEPLVLTLADGSNPMPYSAGAFMMQRGMCWQSGAAMWWPIDLVTQQTVEVCRRNLSDSLLTLFD